MESLVPAFVVCPVCDTRLCWGDVVLNARRRAANGSQIVFAQVSFVYSVYLVVCVCVSVCGCLCLCLCLCACFCGGCCHDLSALHGSPYNPAGAGTVL